MSLTHIEFPQKEGGAFRLHFHEGRDDPSTGVFEPGAAFEVEADRVVLAMPKRSLELLDHGCPDCSKHATNPWLSKAFRDLRDSVMGQPALKIFLAYRSRWWRTLGLGPGRSTTDLPLRQVYFFTTKDGAEQDADGRALVMASYNDGLASSFWSSLIDASEDPGYVGMEDGDPLYSHRVRRPVVELVQNQLRQMHGAEAFIPDPFLALTRNWTKDPFGGGWHFWNVGRKSWVVAPLIRQPFRPLPLFVCGEAYSTNQGWIEGALETAERVLQEHLGQAPPAWLPAGSDLGD